jgi:hypothetical protein
MHGATESLYHVSGVAVAESASGGQVEGGVTLEEGEDSIFMGPPIAAASGGGYHTLILDLQVRRSHVSAHLPRPPLSCARAWFRARRSRAATTPEGSSAWARRRCAVSRQRPSRAPSPTGTAWREHVGAVGMLTGRGAGAGRAQRGCCLRCARCRQGPATPSSSPRSAGRPRPALTEPCPTLRGARAARG